MREFDLRVQIVTVVGIMFLMSPGIASATDQLIFGRKLLIKNPASGPTRNKVVHLGKDAGITVGPAGSAGDPQCGGLGGGGASLRIVASSGAGDVTIPLPCGGWTTNGSNTLYKYRDSTDASCKLVLVKNGVLVKAVCGGSQVAIDVRAGMAPVAVVTTLNTQQYCTLFGGNLVHSGSNDKTFLSKDAPAPSGCPTTTTTTLPGATCCQHPESLSCFDIGNASDAAFCTFFGGTGSSGVCDGATGTCQPTYGGESGCCAGAPGIPCVEGPDVDEALCINAGGMFANDSCADGCATSTSTTSSSTTITSTSTTFTTSTTNTTSTSTTTSTSSTTTSTAYPPCTTLGALCGSPACVSVCQMTHCGSAGCTLACMDDDVTPGPCNTDADCPSPYQCGGCSAATCSTTGGFCLLRHEDRHPGCP